MSDEVKLEEEWVKAKQEKQAAALRTPPKSRKGLIIAIVGILVAAAMVVVVVLAGDEPRTQQSASADKIKIELRSNPTAEIRVDGKKVGKTPISLQYPKSDKEITIEATLVRHLVKRNAKKDETYQGIRRIKLNRDHLYDFTFENTTLIDVKEQKPEEP